MNDTHDNSQRDPDARARAAFGRGQERHHQLHGPAMISECGDPVCQDLFLAAGWRYPGQITEDGDAPAGVPGDDTVIAWAVAAACATGEMIPLGSTGDILAVITAAQAAAAAHGDDGHILASLQAWAVSGTGPEGLLITVELSDGLRITGDVLPAAEILARLPAATMVETSAPALRPLPPPAAYPPQVACSAVLTAVLGNAHATITRAWQLAGPDTWRPPAAPAPFAAARGGRPARRQIGALVGPQRAAEWEAAVLDAGIDPDGILSLMLDTYRQGAAARTLSQRRMRRLGSAMEQQLAAIRAATAGADAALADFITAESDGT